MTRPAEPRGHCRNPPERAPIRPQVGAGQEGSAVLEAVIAAPLVILLLVVLIGAGRISGARQLVDDAAGDAARAASQARSEPAALDAAHQAAADSLAGRGVSCDPMNLAVDTSDWRPGGMVGVTLSCTAGLDDLPGPLAGRRVVTGRAASVIDTYRQIEP